MNTRRLLVVITIILAPWLGSQTIAQVEQVDLGVDGLACPFCSYGLEKKLNEIKGVDEVSIYIDKGIASIKGNKGESIDVDQLDPVVKDAGFTTREISVVAVGKITMSEGRPVLLANDNNTNFILKSNEALEKLLNQLAGAERSVRVVGTLMNEMPQNHKGHPYTLTIREFTL